MGHRRTRLRALNRLRKEMRQICTDYKHLGGRQDRLSDALFLQCLADLPNIGDHNSNKDAFLGVMKTMSDKIDTEYQNGWFPTFITPSRSRLYGLLQPIVSSVPQEKHAECLRQAGDFLAQVKDYKALDLYRKNIDELLDLLPSETMSMAH